MSQYEDTFFSYFDAIKNLLKIQPILLGGGAGSGGGSGGPPGGYIGQLPQSRVAYDTTEASTYATPASGTSLVDNLNHIRASIDAIQTLASGVQIENDAAIIESGVTILDFISPLHAELVSSSRVEISYSGDLLTTWYSGVWNETHSTNGPLPRLKKFMMSLLGYS